VKKAWEEEEFGEAARACRTCSFSWCSDRAIGDARSGAAKIDITLVSILAAHVISNIRIFDSTYV
jgi:hypothetical protein